MQYDFIMAASISEKDVLPVNVDLIIFISLSSSKESLLMISDAERYILIIIIFLISNVEIALNLLIILISNIIIKTIINILLWFIVVKLLKNFFLIFLFVIGIASHVN